MTTRYGIAIRIHVWRRDGKKQVSADGSGRQRYLPRWSSNATHRLVTGLVGLWSLILCWLGVNWAFHPRTFLIQDEIGDLGWPLRVSYPSLLHLFPRVVLFDRPFGFAFLRVLYEQFGFDYRPHLVAMLALHFINLIFVFVLLRRLGTRLPLSLTGLGAFGGLWVTAAAATYLGGGEHDVLCTLFMLGSTLAILSERPWLWYLSALSFLLSLRSKEWGIVIPVFLTALVIVRLAPRFNLRRLLIEAGKRLWAHYLILLVYGSIYLSLAAKSHAKLASSAPYHVDLGPSTIYQSLVFYTALIFAADGQPWRWILFAGLVLICVYALIRRRGLILFGAFAYVLTLLPVSMIPNQRSQYYAYGPQIFLILTLCLFLEDILDLTSKTQRQRWTVGVCVAAAILTMVSFIRASNYYRDRIHWTWWVRGANWKSAQDAEVQLSKIGPGSHVYVDSGNETPWLFAPGPCVFLQVWRNDYSIQCFLQQPGVDLRAQYDRDTAEKYFVQYERGGALTTRLSSPRLEAAAPPAPVPPPKTRR